MNKQGSSARYRPWRRTALSAALRRSPAQVVSALSNRHSLAVPAYHAVEDPDAFERHVRHFVSHHHPICLGDLIEAIDAGVGLPDRAVLLTFDDGDKTIVEQALPIMREYGVPGVLFAVAGHVDSYVPFWWEEAQDLVARDARIKGWPESTPQAVVRRMKTEPQGRRLDALRELRETADGISNLAPRHLSSADLRTLEAGGISVQNHTFTHPSLDQCDANGVAQEIQDAHAALHGILGHEPVAFAYPGGYYAETARPVLQKLGYRAAFLFDHRLDHNPALDPLRISRLRVDADVPVDQLAIILSGLHPALLRALRRI